METAKAKTIKKPLFFDVFRLFKNQK